MVSGLSALGFGPQRSGDRPACLQTSYPSTPQRQFLSLLFSTHLPPMAPVAPQQESFYPLSFHLLTDPLLSNRGVHPLLCGERSPRRASASSGGYVFLLSQKSLKYRRFRPGKMPVFPSSRITCHQSRVTLLLRSASARIAHFFTISSLLATLTFFMGGEGGPLLRPPHLPRFFDRPRRPLYTNGLRRSHGKT
jgi:hypothetical protein